MNTISNVDQSIISTMDFEKTLLTRGEGCWVLDIDENKYLDCESGIWCNNLGHRHPEINKSAKQQIDKLIHTGTRFLTPITIKTATSLCQLLPGDFSKVTFLNSGSESVDFAIKIARLSTQKSIIVSITGGYLGAFGAASSASGSEDKSNNIKLPLITDSYAKSRQCEDSCDFSCINSDIWSALKTNIACFVFESILVSGGIYKPCTKLIQEICRIIHKQQGIVISNEVTTGFGRTGKLFGYLHHQISPDIVTLGKALGNGFPISAVVITNEIDKKLQDLNFYYAQSHQLDPFGCAIADKVIQLFTETDFSQQSSKLAEEILQFIKETKTPFIKAVRGYGMTIGIEIQDYRKNAALEILEMINSMLLQRGIIIGLSKFRNLLRFLPPLIIREEEIKFFKEHYEDTITQILHELDE
ncbi:MAG: class-III pyridoxal-phosphate-dependent aminotransferase [Candidatus Kariarchaeaceae archaeon]